ncbi:MAG TPA: hypothetical protein VF297_01595 [Pyrinomonadaceae bacterium]
MGKTLKWRLKVSVLVLAAAFFTFTNYSCRSQPAPATGDANRAAAQPSPGTTAAPPPAPTPPPYPSTFPQGFPAAVVSGNIPLAVPTPIAADNVTTPEGARPWFDYFSWESFIALNWPAQTGTRGVPNQPNDPSVFYGAAPGTPVVWGTYKDSFELFGQGNNRPTPWETYDEPVNPCGNTQTGQKVLTFFSKGNNPLMQTKEAFSYPLIDQQRNYVYYDIRYDKAQYDFVRGQDGDQSTWLYLYKNLAAKEPVQMPQSTASPAVLGSIMMKSAWRLKTDKDDASRYYTVSAQLYDPASKTCQPATVMLVGLHIGHKVAPFTAWVWSTFEQVDNVPPTGQPSPTPPPNGYSFNNGTAQPATPNGYDYRPPVDFQPDPTQRKPVQVTRINAIPTTPAGASTVEINAYFQQLLKGTPWQYYQLVVTQWPSNPGAQNVTLMEQGGVYPQGAGSAFPVFGAVNTTAETYFQTQNDAAGAGGNSCMSCHYRAGQTDFSWGLNRRAH